ncbi:MAG: metallophosphoesterase [Acidimicrobiia bacterium]|nr:metallophosphoesterase [Acidimicrobiia bacterium]
MTNGSSNPASPTAEVRILHVSDTHLSQRAPEANRNWSAVVRHAATTKPDLVVHTGDLTLDGAARRDDLVHARAALAELDAAGVPWVIVAGNHDLGDAPPTAHPVDDARRRAFAREVGESFWALELGGWRLVGADVQTLATPGAAADELWSRLEAALVPGPPTALFIHRPLFEECLDEEVTVPSRYLAAATRDRLWALGQRASTRLVASGHVHQWRQRSLDGCEHVWAPSSWASLPDSMQPVIGDKVTGVVEYGLGADVRATLVQPAGLDQLVIGVDFPLPYG